MRARAKAARANTTTTTATTLLALGLALLASTAACSNDVGPALSVDGPALYGQMCARCHGLDGHGDAEMKKVLPKIRDFSDRDFHDRRAEEVERVIMGGKEQMPAFGGSLSQIKIQHLAGYVRRLGAGLEKSTK
jgi:mono/diheme cytochrome c family protein